MCKQMKSIKRLPQSVHTSLRSSVYLFDLTRVVEELILNSVDACSTKVHISLSVNSFSVKVDDNGLGITREGLVLLGEKHATSKLHAVVDLDSNFESLNYRGETLGSLSDVSILEVLTRARGRPNAYCKILKDWKCLFLGISDHKPDVGTTVIVRDLFYNQPVRRRQLQSSSKKVLYSVKKCIIRIALLHPQVSFKVIDIDNDNELFCTMPFVSPLPLISNAFGDEVSNSLHEINASTMVYRLSGYLSRPADTFSPKAFQYLYINSRFISKGPIHKLIDNLSSDHQYLVSLRRGQPELQISKRNKIQWHASYLLELFCPFSTYDLTFEPSKTIAEFKDWTPVLSFIEQAVRNFWKQASANISHGTVKVDYNDDDHVKENAVWNGDTVQTSKRGKEKCDAQSDWNSTSQNALKTSEVPSTNFDIHCKRNSSPAGSDKKEEILKLCHYKSACIDQRDCFSQTRSCGADDIFSSSSAQMVFQNACTYPGNLLPENMLMHNGDFWDADKDDYLYSKSNKPSVNADRGLYELSRENIMEHHVSKNGYYANVSFLSGYASVDSLPITTFNSNHKDFGVKSAESSENGFSLNNTDDAPGIALYFSTETPLQGKVATYGSPFVMKRCQSKAKSDFLSGNFSETYHEGLDVFEERENNTRCSWKSCTNGIRHQFSDPDWYFESLDSQSAGVLRSNCSVGKYTLDGKDRSQSRLCSNHFGFIKAKKNQNYFQCSEVLPITSLIMSNWGNELLYSPENIAYDECLSDSFYSSELNDETAYLHSESAFVDENDTFESFHAPLFINSEQHHTPTVRHRRSQSAPPFYKRKTTVSLTCEYFNRTSGMQADIPFLHNGLTSEEFGKGIKEFSQKCDLQQPLTEQDLGECFQSCSSFTIDTPWAYTNQTKHNGRIGKIQCHTDSCVEDIDDFPKNGIDYLQSDLSKWRNGNSELPCGDRSYNFSDVKDDILNISSGLLSLAGSFLETRSVSRDSLENAKVLFQLDRKFIPIVADGTIALIDQHAADERIRLEELREKVLSGEGIISTYLDAEQELVLPEIGFQLLQNYADQIKKWGWICNIHIQQSESFSKNLTILKRQPCNVTLVAVPCVLGINLNDKDLAEFLEQLAETDGSSAIPPSVNRILNLKACRGAIMFGDTLLPSECTLIFEELKGTSLCFQCAHGRPTIVPLVNMVELRKQLARLQQQTDCQQESWHGLCQHRPSIERAQQRLSASANSCNQ